MNIFRISANFYGFILIVIYMREPTLNFTQTQKAHPVHPNWMARWESHSTILRIKWLIYYTKMTWHSSSLCFFTYARNIASYMWSEHIEPFIDWIHHQKMCVVAIHTHSPRERWEKERQTNEKTEFNCRWLVLLDAAVPLLLNFRKFTPFKWINRGTEVTHDLYKYQP